MLYEYYAQEKILKDFVSLEDFFFGKK